MNLRNVRKRATLPSGEEYQWKTQAIYINRKKQGKVLSINPTIKGSKTIMFTAYADPVSATASYSVMSSYFCARLRLVLLLNGLNVISSSFQQTSVVQRSQFSFHNWVRREWSCHPLHVSKMYIFRTECVAVLFILSDTANLVCPSITKCQLTWLRLLLRSAGINYKLYERVINNCRIQNVLDQKYEKLSPPEQFGNDLSNSLIIHNITHCYGLYLG